MSAPASVAELLELIARKLHSRGHAHGLFPAQWVALRYFARAEPSQRTASELARFQGLANGPVSRTVRTLVQKGLLTKAKEQPKGRAERLEPSAAGSALLEDDPTRDLEAAIALLTPEDQQSLGQSLEAISNHLR